MSIRRITLARWIQIEVALRLRYEEET